MTVESKKIFKIFLQKVCKQQNFFCIFAPPIRGSSSVGRAPAFQAGCREFEPRLPLQNPK